MTAIDELCRMLAKMGVEYVLDEEYGKKYPPEQRVTWSCDIAGEDMTVTARDYCIGRDESGEWEYCLDLEFHEVFTPAQAIAATVGRGTCEADETETIKCWVKCKDEPSTEHMELIHVMECSECGHTYEHVNGDYEFCPRCGRKRVDA